MKFKRIFIFLLCLGLISTVKINAFHSQNKTVEPVDWEELATFLTDVPGYEKEGEPEGQTVSMMNQQWSKVSQKYSAEKGDNEFKMEIVSKQSQNVPLSAKQKCPLFGWAGVVSR